MTVNDLPALNATLNGTAAILLTAGFVFIKCGQIRAHRACMLTAFGVSCVFLTTYVIHHLLKNSLHTKFGGEGAIWWFYVIMLTTHIILAMVIVPLILVTMSHALKGRFDRHRIWARVTFPLWYYVSVTGVMVYFFLYQWYPALP